MARYCSLAAHTYAARGECSRCIAAQALQRARRATMARGCGVKPCSWCFPRTNWSRHTEKLAIAREVLIDLDPTPLPEETHMRYIKRVQVRPTLGQRAAAPVSTSDLLKRLGYTEIDRKHDAAVHTFNEGSTRFVPAGGKRRGYAPRYS